MKENALDFDASFPYPEPRTEVVPAIPVVVVGEPVVQQPWAVEAGLAPWGLPLVWEMPVVVLRLEV